jgi:bifunctional non-homologous end joining protein LigD
VGGYGKCNFAFDLLELEGEDLRDRPIEERKAKLARLLHDCDGIRLVEHLDEDGGPVFEHACRLGFEGIVSKRQGSRYQSGRCRHWIKTRNPGSPAACRIAESDALRTGFRRKPDSVPMIADSR